VVSGTFKRWSKDAAIFDASRFPRFPCEFMSKVNNRL
jgi:hypothetical protein